MLSIQNRQAKAMRRRAMRNIKRARWNRLRNAIPRAPKRVPKLIFEDREYEFPQIDRRSRAIM